MSPKHITRPQWVKKAHEISKLLKYLKGYNFLLSVNTRASIELPMNCDNIYILRAIELK